MKEIVQKDNPVLREVSKPVPESMFGTKKLTDLIKDMSEALDAEPDGVAIAAPQIGVSLRVFVVRYDRTLPPPKKSETSEETDSHTESERRPADVGVYINPKIVKSSRKRELVDEGCLSVRGLYGHTMRHNRATVRAQDANGKHFERGGGGILAQIFQHEMEHLEGTLFIDHAEDIIEVKHDGAYDEHEGQDESHAEHS
jgi:peptide deformylase